MGILARNDQPLFDAVPISCNVQLVDSSVRWAAAIALQRLQVGEVSQKASMDKSHSHRRAS